MIRRNEDKTEKGFGFIIVSSSPLLGNPIFRLSRVATYLVLNNFRLYMDFVDRLSLMIEISLILIVLVVPVMVGKKNNRLDMNKDSSTRAEDSNHRHWTIRGK